MFNKHLPHFLTLASLALWTVIIYLIYKYVL